MATMKRTEVYWREGRLHPCVNERPTGHGPWPKSQLYQQSELVVTIEGGNGNFNITNYGPFATPERVEDSVLLHLGILPNKFTSAIWSEIPVGLLDEVSNRIQRAEMAVSNQWDQFSNEEANTGALFSRLQCEIELERWGLELKFVEFSKQKKEPVTGTDIAIILDAKAADGRRSFKTLWLQAKRVSSFPKDPNSLPRFGSQAKAAAEYTEDFYGIVYTPQGVYVTGKKIAMPNLGLHTVIRKAMQCRLGDMTVETLKNSLNKKHVFEVILTEAG